MKNKNNLYSIISMILIVVVTWVIASMVVGNNDNKEEKNNNKSNVVLGKGEATLEKDEAKDSDKNKEDNKDIDKKTEGNAEKKDKKEEGEITITSLGNILIHDEQLNSAKKNDGYDFSSSFEYIKERVKGSDIAIAVLETTLQGNDNYSGYPFFNTPDVIIDNLKDTGISHVNFGNNHILDGGQASLPRTINVTRNRDLGVLGIRKNVNEDNYTIEEFNGEKIGLISYVYESAEIDGVSYVNGIPMEDDTKDLINTFNYEKLDSFYSDLEKNISTMKNKGANFIVVNLHWGSEYSNEPDWYQKTIAKKLNDMGVNIILGNHPHVIQPYEILTNSEGNKTFVSYSQGNNLSNQCLETVGNAKTEDGFILKFNIKKGDNGLEIKDYTVIPVWTLRELREDGKYSHKILPLDDLEIENGLVYGQVEKERVNNILQRIEDVLGEGKIGTFKF